jgi:hypothetical protein
MAPPTFTPIPNSATPYSIVYEIVGHADEGTLLWTTMQTQLAEGPLKTALGRLAAATPTGLAVLDTFGGTQAGLVKITHIVCYGQSEGSVSGSDVQINWVATGLHVQLPPTGETISTALIEIRFQHSARR